MGEEAATGALLTSAAVHHHRDGGTTCEHPAPLKPTPTTWHSIQPLPRAPTCFGIVKQRQGQVLKGALRVVVEVAGHSGRSVHDVADAALAQRLEVARRARAADKQAICHAGRQHILLGAQAQRGQRAERRRLGLRARLGLRNKGGVKLGAR